MYYLLTILLMIALLEIVAICYLTKKKADLFDGLLEENRCLYEENKDLRFENEEQRELLIEVADRSVTCPLDSEKIVLDKIKELVRDYQSKN